MPPTTLNSEEPLSGVTPHRTQASSRSCPTMTFPVIADDASPTLNCTWPGSPAPVREHDTRCNGGGLQH